MPEFHGSREMAELRQQGAEKFQNIQPETGITSREVKNYIGKMFESVGKIFETKEEHYVSEKVRYDRTPTTENPDGKWQGERGDSKYFPSENTEKGITAKEKLAEYGMDGVEYKNAEPDFSKCTEATVQIDNMTEKCQDNFPQADKKCAEQWNLEQREGRTDWTARQVKEWRMEHECSWHERCDMKTMDLVPRAIHECCKHSGGRAECKARDAAKAGGDT